MMRYFIMNWIVYCHIHKATGREYIGLTKKTMLARWNHHVYMANRFKNGKPENMAHFPNAIRKYGKDAFEHRILERDIHTIEEANEREDYLIEERHTRDPQFGFNLMRGGGSQPHPIRKNPWDDPKYRAKATIRSKEQAKNPQFLKKLSDGVKLSISKPEVRERRAAASKKVRENYSFREKLSILSKSAFSDPLLREKISVATTIGIVQHPKSKETLARMSKAQKGKTCSIITKEKLSHSSKKFWDENREIMEAALRKGFHSPESREKIARAHVGQKHTFETKSKISTAVKLRNEKRIKES